MQGVGFQLEIFCAEKASPLPEDRKVPNLDLLTHGMDIAFVAEVNGTYGVFIRDNTGNLIEIFEEDTPKS